MAYTMDSNDFKLLRKFSEEGPSFTKHSAHEMRAYEMTQLGLLERENALYKYNASSGVVEYRWRYAITAKGKSYLKNEKKNAS